MIDTGTPLTAYDDHPASSRLGNFRLYTSAADASSARLEYDSVRVFFTPLRSLGLDPAYPVQAVLGGDNLQRSSVMLDYRNAQPQMTLTPQLTNCSCALSPSPDPSTMPRDCQAVFPFSLEGGQNVISLGGDLFNYPPTRVIVEACVEPLLDPLSRDVACNLSGDTSKALDDHYLSTKWGTDMRFEIATGFPGVALSQSAFNRIMRMPGDHPTTTSVALHLPDPDDDDFSGDHAGILVGKSTIGDAIHSSLALVSREGWFGPCAELARSRRLRRLFTLPPNRPTNESACQLTGADPAIAECNSSTGHDCTDLAAHTTASIVELEQPLAIYVLPDNAPILQSLNGDVQPSNASVDGILGTDALRLLVSTVDYPGGRLIAACAADRDHCVAYPRFTNGSDCGLPCTTPDAITQLAVQLGVPGGLCPKAP